MDDDTERQRLISEEATLVRKHIATSINNSHQAIKSMWLIMFPAGTIAALNTLRTEIRCGMANHPGITDTHQCVTYAKMSPWGWFQFSIYFLVYFITFTRFYLGDVRMFDERFSEVYLLVADAIERRQRDQASGTQRLDQALGLFVSLIQHNDNTIIKFEGVWLVFQTLMVVFLAHQLDDANQFLFVYVILLLSNSLWLIIVTTGVKAVITDTNKELFPFWQKDKKFEHRYPRFAALRWAANNVLHAVALIGVLAMSWQHFGLHSKLIGGLLCLSNCIFDFALTRNYYFPKFGQFYRAFCQWKDGSPSRAPDVPR